MPEIAVTENGNTRSDKNDVRFTKYLRDVCPEVPAESQYCTLQLRPQPWYRDLGRIASPANSQRRPETSS